MIDNQFTEFELQKILERALDFRKKIWSSTNGNKLASSRIFYCIVIDSIKTKIASLHKCEPYLSEKPFSKQQIEMTFQYKLLEIAEGRLDNINNNKPYDAHSTSGWLEVDFKIWLQKSYFIFNSFEQFLSNQITRCRNYLAETKTYNKDFISPELLTVLEREYALLTSSETNLVGDSESSQNQDTIFFLNSLEEKGTTFQFKNNFDQTETVEIYHYFDATLVKKRYISTAILKNFLKAAFERTEKPKKKFKLQKGPLRQDIIRIFYNFYKEVAVKKQGDQKKYASLLGEYFENFDTQLVRNNFSK